MPIVPTVRKIRYRGTTWWEVDARSDTEMMRRYRLAVRRRFPTKQAAQEWVQKVIETTSRSPTAHHGIKVRTLKERFLRWCEAGGVSSAGTARTYGYQLGRFSDWCRSRGISYVDQVSRAQVGDYEDYLRAEQLAPATVSKYLAAVRRMLGWATDREWIEYNPAAGAVPSAPSPERRILTPAEQRKISRHSELPWRHVWIIMLDTGVRIAEVTELGGDTEHRGDHLHVLGKGNKRRKVPLSEAGSAAATAALEAGILPARKHTVVRYQFGLMCEALGIEDASPHTLRHTYASEMANDYGVPISVLQIWLGHERLETTARYLHADWRQASEAVKTRGKRW